ncbi:MAG: hypothetical protein Q3966_03055, partial [Neisseria sp.]|nr:hypothetical protein [Neisseria sp.]
EILMNRRQIFADMVFRQTARALAQLPQDIRKDIYALSFWLDGGNSWLPSLSVSYNTEGQVGKTCGLTLHQDEEARWNYAYWLQDEAELLAVNECANNGELQSWLENSPFAYTEAQYDEGDETDDVDEKSEAFYQAFAQTLITVVQRLFGENVIAEALGRNIPVLVHELEYYGLPLSWTERANPPGLADDFVNYWRGRQ